MPTQNFDKIRGSLRPTVDRRVADYADATAAAAADRILAAALARSTAIDQDLDKLTQVLKLAMDRIVLLEKQVQSLTDIAARQVTALSEQPISRAEAVNRARNKGREEIMERELGKRDP